MVRRQSGDARQHRGQTGRVVGAPRRARADEQRSGLLNLVRRHLRCAGDEQIGDALDTIRKLIHQNGLFDVACTTEQFVAVALDSGDRPEGLLEFDRTGRCGEACLDHLQLVVAGGAVDGEERLEFLVETQALLDVDEAVRAEVRTQSAEIADRVGQAVDVIDADAVDQILGHEFS